MSAGRPAAQSLGPLRVVASGPDLRSVFDKVRDLINAQRACGAMCEAEAVGARWAVDKLEKALATARRGSLKERMRSHG